MSVFDKYNHVTICRTANGLRALLAHVDKEFIISITQENGIYTVVWWSYFADNRYGSVID